MLISLQEEVGLQHIIPSREVVGTPQWLYKVEAIMVGVMVEEMALQRVSLPNKGIVLPSFTISDKLCSPILDYINVFLIRFSVGRMMKYKMN